MLWIILEPLEDGMGWDEVIIYFGPLIKDPEE
jgi:hypothetical protein